MLSSKLMTMKFMTNANKDAATTTTKAGRDDETHWRLDFRHPQTHVTSPTVVESSYTSFSGMDQGRRKFQRHVQVKDEEEEEENGASVDEKEGEGEEAPEDVFARRQAERKSDSDNLKGLKSLAGARRPTAADKNAPKGKKQKRNKIRE